MKKTNIELQNILLALSGLQELTLPFDFAYAIGRNIAKLKEWNEYMTASKNAVFKAAGIKESASGFIDQSTFEALEKDVRETIDAASLNLGNELYAKDIDWFQIPVTKLQAREDGKVIEVPAKLITPLIGVVVIE